MMAWLKRSLQCAAVVFGLGAALFPSGGQAEIAGFVGGNARVVVFDASGSMRKKSFADDVARIEVAREILAEVYRKLESIGDPVPTALSIFGEGVSWDDNRDDFGRREDDVPLDHPLCLDIQTRIDFAAVSADMVQVVSDLAPTLDFNGMTPIHQSLLDGLRAFNVGIDGATLQFVLISDLDRPNCLPPGMRICDALQFELDRIKGAGGRVEAIVFETPSADIRKPLSECLPVTTFPLAPAAPNPKAAVAEAFDTFRLTARVLLDGAGLDTEGVDMASAYFEVADGSGKSIRASGPGGQFDLPRGEYILSVNVDGVSARQKVSLLSDSSVDLLVPPAGLAVTASLAGLAGPQQFERLQIARSGGQVVADLAAYRGGDVLSLANGSYQVTGYDDQGRTASATVLLTLGETQSLVLDFGDVAAKGRNVFFAVEIAQPTLVLGASWSPKLELVHPNGVTQTLTASGNSEVLDPGRYELRISGRLGSILPFDVIAGPSALRVDVRVIPGWFVVESTRGEGRFELKDAAGGPLFSFEGERIEHSLPEGRYTIAFRGGDGLEVRRDFDILTGQATVLPPF